MRFVFVLFALAACTAPKPIPPRPNPGTSAFRVSLSVSPFSEVLASAGVRWTDGVRTASSVEDLQRLFVAHGSNEVFARIGTRRTRGNADVSNASLARGIERAQLARKLGLQFNPELSLFGTYGDLSCQTEPDVSEYPELPLSGAWQTLDIEARVRWIRAWAALAAQQLVATGANINIWDLGNEVNFGIAGVSVQPLPGSACDGSEGSTTWYRAPDVLDPAIGKQSVKSLLEMPSADRVAWLSQHVWPLEARLLAAAADGVRSIVPEAKFSTHISMATDTDLVVAFFAAMKQGGYSPDVFGLSYYPTGDAAPDDRNTALRHTLDALGKPVFLAEVGYPSKTMSEGAFASWNHPLPGYPLTEEGQAAFFSDLAAWNSLSGIRPWGPDIVEPGWNPMSFFGTDFHARAALNALADRHDAGSD